MVFIRIACRPVFLQSVRFNEIRHSHSVVMGSVQRHWQRIVFVLLMLAASLAGFQARAQGFGLATSNTPPIALVNAPVTYTITVTNLTGGNLNDYEVTNTFS